MVRPSFAAAAAALLLVAGSTSADGQSTNAPRFFVGVGVDDAQERVDPPSPAVAFEFAGRAVDAVNVDEGARIRVSPRVAAVASLESAYFAGVGLALEVFPFHATPLFFEGGAMAGVFHRNDVFYPFEFRGQLGVGWEFENGVSVALVGDHKSNGDMGRSDSPTETLMIRVGAPFAALGFGG